MWACELLRRLPGNCFCGISVALLLYSITFLNFCCIVDSNSNPDRNVNYKNNRNCNRNDSHFGGSTLLKYFEAGDEMKQKNRAWWLFNGRVKASADDKPFPPFLDALEVFGVPVSEPNAISKLLI